VRVKAFAARALRHRSELASCSSTVLRRSGQVPWRATRNRRSADEERFTQCCSSSLGDLALAWRDRELDFELVKHERSPVFVNVGAARLIIVNRFRVDFDSGGGTSTSPFAGGARAACRCTRGCPRKPPPRLGDWPRTPAAYLNDALVACAFEMGSE